MVTVGESFANTVVTNYRSLTSPSGAKSIQASAAQIESGHPSFADLRIGERATCEIASVFLDLTNFTGRTFWDTPDEVASLAHAVLTGFTGIVQKLGGHVLGLRGDGLFAGFGPCQSDIAVALATATCAAALDSVQNWLNPRLDALAIERVLARAGADYGSATFVRSGTTESSEINIIGFASNFAAKCEKYANSWELVVGEKFSEHVNNPTLLSEHGESPKKYTRKHISERYRFYDYRWSEILSEVPSTIEELGGSPAELIRIGK
jgi:class 3 adenylate cyclase